MTASWRLRSRLRLLMYVFLFQCVALILSNGAPKGIARQHNINNFTANMKTSSTLHLVVTRFQQYQPHLLALGQARLHLFNTFCLPSMRAQTSQNFIWLILTDPLLDTTLREQIQTLLAPHHNYFLLPRLGFLTSESFLSGEMASQEVWAGSLDIWRAVTAPKNRFAVHLHTRLDADDGLHVSYLQRVQADATLAFSPARDRQQLKWKFFCLIGEAGGRVLEWQQSSCDGGQQHAQDSTQRLSVGDHRGFLRVSVVEKQCISAGLTFAFASSHPLNEKKRQRFKSNTTKIVSIHSSTAADVTHFPHEMHYPRHAKLWDLVTSGVFGSCRAAPGPGPGAGSGRGAACIAEGVGGGDSLQYYALRARTPTSAGMNRVAGAAAGGLDPPWWSRLLHWLRPAHSAAATDISTAGSGCADRAAQLAYWAEAQSMFGLVDMTAVEDTSRFFKANMRAILEDAVAGHCKPELTCKQDSLQKLQQLLRVEKASAAVTRR